MEKLSLRAIRISLSGWAWALLAGHSLSKGRKAAKAGQVWGVHRTGCWSTKYWKVIEGEAGDEFGESGQEAPESILYMLPSAKGIIITAHQTPKLPV